MQQGGEAARPATSRLLQPQGGAEAVGERGTVLFRQRPGILGDGNLGDGKPGPGCANRKRPSEAVAPCSVTVITSLKPTDLATAAISTRFAVRPRWRPVSPNVSLSSTSTAKFLGAWSPTTASEPNPIIISPSPVMASTRRPGWAKARPSAVGTARPIPPQE